MFAASEERLEAPMPPPPQTPREQSLGELKLRLDQLVARSAMVFLGLVILGALAQMLTLAMQSDQNWPERVSRMGTSACVFMSALIALALARMVGVRAATAFFSISAMLILFVAAGLYGLGLHSSGMAGVLLLMSAMGLMVGPQAAKWATLAAVLGYLLMWALEAFGLIAGLTGNNSPPLASYAVVYIATALILGWMALRYGSLFWDVTGSLERSRRLLAETVKAQQAAALGLRESEERLRILLDNSLTCIQILEGDTGALRFANAQTLVAYGCTRLTELDATLMYPGEPFSSEQMLQRLRLTVERGSAQYFEWQSRRVDGSPIWWDMKLDRLQLGEEVCVVLFAHDITARVRAETELRIGRARLEDEVAARTAELVTEKQLMQDILEALPITLSIRDLQGRYTLVNRNFETATQLPRDKVLGTSARELFAAEMAAEIADIDAKLMAGTSSLTVERQLTDALGGEHDYLITTVPLLDTQKRPVAVLNLGTEVTSLKRLQRELSQAKDEAERLAVAKSEFLANMSHEIRTPLNAVLGLAQLGISRSGDPAAARSGFERIVRSGRHLLGVINDILDYSKVESGKLDIESLPCNLSHLVKEVTDLVSERADAKNLRLRIEYKASHDWVMLDALRATQILVNLLSNAIKFTDKGRVVLSVEQVQGRLLFSVTDTGVGIAPEQLKRVFTAFEQADSSTTRKFGGTGLGLSISSQLAELMGGSITATSELGSGSCFKLELPLVLATVETRDPATTEPMMLTVDIGPNPLRGLRILITDDVDINREILQDMLSHAGAEVMASDSGAQAVARLREAGPEGFDLVLMDIQMPDMDGYEATRRIHQLAPKLKVIALTAHALPEQRRRCLAAGMVAHVTKPIDQAELIQVLMSQAEGLPRRPASVYAAPSTGTQAESVNEPAASSTSPSALSLWPQIDGTDFEAALTRCAGRQELLAKLLGTFAKQYAQHLTQFEEAQVTGLPALCSAAHRLRGLAGNLGLERLAQKASALEVAAGPQGDPAGVADALDALNRELGPLVSEVAEWHRRYSLRGA
ncbi:ATP-binding protein [Paucibacter sp. Y2R2-4]|uniref:ATP-binding protein n=1 Tax=Paucibacter sp. Y2R2-4 TaxID=2893553 RepID=UPI0021E36F3F|nr:ATP-binding protein [Paucibacter sp. Y2R2-4]MCV2351675.1 response regulator [Paucibacter sp. Y2R2-4]